MPSDKIKPVGLTGAIHSVHDLKPVRNWRSCDPRRQYRLAADLTGWLATAPGDDPLQVTLVVPDETRPLKPEMVLPPIVDAIAESARRRGADIEVSVLVGTGLHSPPSKAFINQIDRALAPFKSHQPLTISWVTHDAQHTHELGLPLNPRVMSRRRGGLADRVIAVGLVEPHQYAGFSGGSKSLTIGCGSSDTIAEMHSLTMLRRRGVTIGSIDGNPFRDKLDSVTRRFAAPTFTVALVPDPIRTGEIAGLFAGAGRRPFEAAVNMASRILMVPVQRQFDFALISVPPTKSANFYQASRALTYLALHPSPCVRPKGMLVLQAQCQDGYGNGQGEEAFRRALSKGRRKLLMELLGRIEPDSPVTGGAQRAYVLARALERFKCVLVGAPSLEEARDAGLNQADHIGVLRLAGAGLIVDDPFVLMPYHDAKEGAAFDRLVELSDRASGSAA